MSPEDVNCRIFRHLVLADGRPGPPHASREECIALLRQGARGCGAAFRLDENNTPVLCGHDS